MPSLAQPPKMDSTLGAAFLGHSATMLLYGVTSMQTYIYYRRSQNDGRVLKLSILVLWFLDSLHAALITAALYWYCVTHFTDPRAIQVPYWPIPTMIIVSNVSNMIVRCVFSYQLWKLNMNKHKWIIPVVIAVASVYIFGDATYFSIQLYSVESFLEVKSFSWSLYLGLSVEAGVDLLVAITQCLLLWSLQTGIQRTDMMLRILITYSINTGLLTSLVAIGALVSYSVSPRNYAYFAFYFVLSKLYVNALLATLNARSTLLEQKRTRGGMPSTVVFRVPTLPASSALGGTPAVGCLKVEYRS
ncbi:hypothetical protein C8Q78DRAFT_1082174 [Trametes maxima]|nr:hypothetical protein C8Q78DRAFT_1082174 [Trametes maxima]